VERDWSDFRFWSGRKWVARLSFYTSFTPAFYRYLLQRCRQMMDSRPARFLFPVALLPVPASWQIPSFQSEYPRGQYHGPILPRLRAEGHTREFGLGDHFLSGYFRFRWVQGGGAGRRHDNRLASGCNKTRFFHGNARIIAVNIPNYTQNWKLRLTGLLTNLLINGDFATKIRRFLRLAYAEMEILTSQQESKTELVLPPAVFPSPPPFPPLSQPSPSPAAKRPRKSS